MRVFNHTGSESDSDSIVSTDNDVSAVGVVTAKINSSERDRCQCDAAGFCAVRSCKVNALLWGKCQAGYSEQVSRLLDGAKNSNPRPQTKRSRVPPADVSTLGTQIRSAFESAMGTTITCGACLTFLKSLNQLATLNHAALVDDLYRVSLPIPAEIRNRHKGPTKFRAWLSSVIAPIVPAPPIVAYPLNFVTSIQPAMRIAKRATPRWYQTLQSIEAAGFRDTLLFAEPDSGPDVVDAADTVWTAKLGPITSFKAMCQELLRWPAEWLLLCEDDIVLSNHAADFVRTWNLTNEVVSLYTCGPRQQNFKGLSEVTKPLVGSLALLIRKSVLQTLMKTKTWQAWPKSDCVDQMVYRACREAHIPLLTHNPSLVQHTGDTAAIYKDRGLTALRTAKDWTQEGVWTPPAVTLITPTGDRHASFTKCEQWMRQQSYTGQIQWIVVDDGMTPTTCTMGQEYIRERPLNYHSLCRNMRAAIPRIKGDVVLVIEDDDYYHPHYVSTMVGRLQHADLVGEFGAKYYYLKHRSWRHNVNSEHHASLCRTGMTRAVVPMLTEVAQGKHPSIDLRLWRQWTGTTLSWRDPDGTQSLCVGIKGVDGRQSHGWRPSRNAQRDRDREVLRRWVGEDARYY